MFAQQLTQGLPLQPMGIAAGSAAWRTGGRIGGLDEVERVHYLALTEATPVATILHLALHGVVEVIALRHEVVRVIGDL